MNRYFVFLLCVFFSFLSFLNASSKLEIQNKGVFVLDYKDYGVFQNIGKDSFKYILNDLKSLKQVVGDYIYPNIGIPSNMKEKYKSFIKNGNIKLDIWENVDSGIPQADLLAWANIRNIQGNSQENFNGIRQFFLGEILNKNAEYEMAIKAYYAVVLFFPRTACWNSDGTFVWYVGQAALDRINLILREHPDLNLKLDGAFIEVENGNDIDLTNDIVKVNPGIFVRVTNKEKLKNSSSSDIINQKGFGKVKLLQYSNNHWQLFVNNKPFIVKGMTYSPTRVGLGSNGQNVWMFSDVNNNGIIDAPYESWVDINCNNKQDLNEKSVGDFALMRDMGVNAIRIYHSLSKSDYLPEEFNKKLLRDMHNTYGIGVVMGDFLGSYGIGTDGGPTDYRDKKQKEMMKENVRKMVLDHKDEPYLLMWMLGNENDMPSTSDGVNFTNTNARKYPDDYALFLKEIIDMIHTLDPNHLVVLGNMTTDLMTYYDKHKVPIDIYGINLYMGKDGFGGTWNSVARKMNLPVLITEYGCDAFYTGKGEDQDSQEKYHRGNWKDISYNLFGGDGSGNSLGGIAFEWLDEWWKSGRDYNYHDEDSDSSLPFADGLAQEEWFGICSQGDGNHSPFLRVLRKTYFLYKDDLWKTKIQS